MRWYLGLIIIGFPVSTIVPLRLFPT
jgi:hypothetical protein